MSEARGTDTSPEFSRTVAVAEFAGEPMLSRVVEADADERAALARRFAILAIGALSARLCARQTMTGDILVEGVATADVVQECVVTLEPVPKHVETRFTQRFSYRPEDLEKEDESEDPLEPVVDDAIEVGEIIAQNVSLALDPYPRAEGVSFGDGEEEGAAAPTGPFASLARLMFRNGE